MDAEPDFQNVAIIVAAGQGARAGGDIAKQWQPLMAQQRVIDVTVSKFLAHAKIDHVIVVVSPDMLDHAQLDTRAQIVLGGETRMASVRAGLQCAATFAPKHVLIHDAARPCVTDLTIDDVLDGLQHTPGVVPALPVSDALFMDVSGTVGDNVDRSPLRRAQTPQGFDFAKLHAAFEYADPSAPDDATIAKSAGMSVAHVPGSEDNIKITFPEDFGRARRILEGQMKVRLGNGYDVHAFTDGDAVILCGVKIPHDKSLLGHSDADVAMHAVTDAIYGALAAGDIGQHFPPSDPQWKGAASDIFLKHAAKLARDKGFEISNIDCTIVCEHPKIGLHAIKMRENMAQIMDMPVADISVKATTSERLGFTGRSEGIAALATAALVSK